jgi:hypothetical protein
MQDKNVSRKSVSASVLKAAARRATVTSAKLERREIPAGYVRTAKVTQFLNERHRLG